MSQKPVDKKLYIDGHQAIWDAIREQRTFTLRSVRMETRLGRDTVRNYLDRLEKAGFIEVSRPDDTSSGTPANIYELIKDCGIDAPRLAKDGSEIFLGRDHLWLAMRILKDFSPKELAINASTEECQISFNSAKEYCIFLARAGYLHRHKNGRYFFLRAKYTGPKAPMIQKVKRVFDPNINQVVWSGQGGAK